MIRAARFIGLSLLVVTSLSLPLTSQAAPKAKPSPIRKMAPAAPAAVNEQQADAGEEQQQDAYVPMRRAAPQHTTAIRVSPLGLLIGSISLSADFAVAPSWTLGPQVNYWNLKIGDFEVNAQGFGVRGNYYLGRSVFEEGWYVGPFASYVSVKVKDCFGLSGCGEGKASGFGFGAIGGYEWMWDSFHINLGLGLALSTVSQVEVTTSTGKAESTGSQTLGGLTGEFTLGWAF